ncbi:MAG: cytochrome c maturation protein CcmE [Gammaproteobacteria bacterium]|nr:cytochrome c maturation protein CcmE [Gammaproteobacteria bacterium]
MNRVRKRRLGVALFVFLGSSTTLALAFYAMQQNLEFFYLPDRVVSGEAPIGKTIRAGGMVVAGSIRRSNEDLSVRFELSDMAGSSFSVVYEGLLPNLFVEGQGAIVSGTLDESGLFYADQVLAKHDENYMPPELADLHPAE